MVVLYSQNYAAGMRGHYREYLPPQNLGIENFKPIKFLYYLNHLESGVLPPPPPPLPSSEEHLHMIQTI